MFDVELVGVKKVYPGNIAINDISFGIEPGKFVTLLGPSGCGKTTTLRCIAGYIIPDAGRILIKGKDIARVPAYKRNCGMVFQNYALFPHMNIYDNIAFGLNMRKVSKDKIGERVKKSLDLIHLSGYEKRYPRQCSGGEQQRVALARALVIEPDVLLLDEPLSNLDFKLRMEMRLEMKRIQRELGITSIYVTHDQAEALAMSDQIVVMSKGMIQQIGTPAEVYARPKTKFVADFIGMANFFEGKISAVGESGLTIATDDGLTLYAPKDGSRAELSENSRVSLFIRPEGILITEKKPSNVKNAFKGKVEEVEYLGSSVKHYIRLDNGHRVIVMTSDSFKVNEEVYISCKPDNCLLLEQET